MHLPTRRRSGYATSFCLILAGMISIGSSVALAQVRSAATVSSSSASSQQPATQDQSQREGQSEPTGGQPQAHQQMPMQMEMEMTGPLGIGMARDGSGTSWLPDATPMYAIHRQAGGWGLMLHNNLFVQYIDENGPRGDDQFGSINWIMGMAQRNVGGGPLMFRAMFSIEPLTVGECGYPDLLASGEFCDDQPLHDRQHPHDLFMELGAQYQREINSSLAFQLYGAIAGEPTLGPVAYPHRVSALPNPLAPVAHHWLDSTHIAFGVVSAGLFQRRWKAEASAFNGREPDQDRYDWDLDQLDSVAGRFWLLPTDRWAFQFSGGRLNEAEEHEIGGPRVDVDRLTASATYHRPGEEQRFWASTIAWGRNREEGVGTNAFLAETSLAIDQLNTVFGRGEIIEKTGGDLALPEQFEEDVFTIGKLEGGYLRQFGTIASMTPGIGASLSVSLVPDGLRPFYDDRASFGFSIFINLRPAAMSGEMGHQNHVAQSMLPAQPAAASTRRTP